MRSSSALKDRVLIFGEMMSGPQALIVLKEELRSLHNAEIVLASAYAKTAALRELEQVIATDNSVRILVRWKPNDLICGASDLECFSLARERGWQFIVRQDLHAKVYLAGDRGIFLGSANLTRSGFSLGIFGNEEAVVCVDASPGNLSFIERLFDGGAEISQELFLRIEQWLLPRMAEQKSRGEASEDWPIEISNELDPTAIPKRLLVSECFWTDGTWLTDEARNRGGQVDEAMHHDALLLNYQSAEHLRAAPIEEKAAAVANTRIARWLKGQMQKSPAREMYFGQVTALLHDALVNDPKPYRREVKDVVHNLFSWIHNTKVPQLQVDRPGHSERIRST